MRADALGFFWRDEPPPPKVKKEAVKCTPPERTWERPDYLPGLDAAMAMQGVVFMTPDDLMTALLRGDELMYDWETYPNYCCACFLNYTTGAVTYVEADSGGSVNVGFLRWLMENFLTVGFNSINFDNTMTELALEGHPPEALAHAATLLIREQQNRADVRKQFKAKKLKCNHIDLMEVAPLRASLKIYGGRIHVPRMQDLPFPPGTVLTPEQKAIVRYYCINDLRSTGYLRHCLQEQLVLRKQMSDEYGLDLRSKSDAQIAEAVIGHELKALTGLHPTKPVIAEGTVYHYKTPAFMRFQTPLLQWVLATVQRALFVVEDHGGVGMPPELANLEIPINSSVYRMGIGGLHSSESKMVHYADDRYLLEDNDVESFYPRIILNQGLFPHHLGPAFLRVYEGIVNRRIDAKRRDMKAIAESLKIVINGSYGKLGSKYSILYSPDLLIQVTLTGQLSLLMLIERLELAGFNVVSANTDGIVTKVLRSRHAEMRAIVKQWEVDTAYKTEDTQYLALYSRDVNNYIAIKAKQDKQTKEWLRVPDGTKNKGAFANPWGGKTKSPADKLHKNPSTQICISAIEQYLLNGTPLMTTIQASKDVRDFISVRKVKGGAVRLADGVGDYLGESIRWYYSTDKAGRMVYADSGKKVPKSDGAKPLLQLPAQLPEDVDFEWYETQAIKHMRTMGLEF